MRKIALYGEKENSNHRPDSAGANDTVDRSPLAFNRCQAQDECTDRRLRHA